MAGGAAPVALNAPARLAQCGFFGFCGGFVFVGHGLFLGRLLRGARYCVEEVNCRRMRFALVS
jgi:hypothetical protein